MYQLEVFTEKSVYMPLMQGDDVEKLRTMHMGAWRSWRIVLLDKARKLRPYTRLSGNRSGRAPSRSIADVQAAYVAWARERGIKTITLYDGDTLSERVPDTSGRRYGYQRTTMQAIDLSQFTVRYVDPADTFGPAVDEADYTPEAQAA